MNDESKGSLSQLRQRAEAVLQRRQGEPEAEFSLEASQLLQELQTHQVELELQNEELRDTQRQLERSRDRFARLYNQAPVGYAILTSSAIIAHANQTLAEMVGVELDRLLGTPFSRLIVPTEQNDFFARFPAFFRKPRNKEMELRLLRTSGEEIAISLRGRPAEPDEFLLRSDYEPPYIWGVVFDITRRKKAEEERLQLQAQLRHKQKLEAIGILAGGVAHEINNPVNIIMNYAQLIHDRLEEESPLRGFGSSIISQTERVAEIVRDLLAFARQEKQPASAFSLTTLIQKTSALIRTVMRHDWITVEVNLPEDLPPVWGHSQQIQQVLMNLLTNARDALNERFPGKDPEKKMGISCVTFQHNEETWVRVRVQDAGVGIPPELQERIFDPFFTTKDRTKGTGLGLAVSHGLVQDNGGALWLQSAPHEGTSFYLELPCLRQGDEKADLED